MSIYKLAFKKVLKSLLVLFTLGILSSCSSYQEVDHSLYQQPLEPTAILNVSVLSQDGETMNANQNVLLENGKISQITQSDLDLAGVKVIDGRGKYLIPGLVDSHAHLQNSPNDLLVYAAHGVTYLREMSGTEQEIMFKEDINKGRIGPKLQVFSEKISSKSGVWGIINSWFWTRINISSAEQAESLAVRLIDQGFDGAKISSDISKSMYIAISQASKDRGLSVAGHIPQSSSFDDLWKTGQKEISHIEEIVKTLNNEFGGYYSKTYDEFLKYVDKRSEEIAIQLKERNISVVTTLWYIETTPMQVLKLETIIGGLDLKYGNPLEVKNWYPGQNKFEASNETKNDPETLKKVKKWWETFVKANHIVFKALLKQNVIMLAGTDSMAPLVIPGVSIHQELESLVNAGMTTAQALRSATLVPGEWMKSNTGKIVEGYAADLVLLTNNPLQDIRNTKQIETVILNGKMLDKSTIDKILRSVKAAYGH